MLIKKHVLSQDSEMYVALLIRDLVAEIESSPAILIGDLMWTGEEVFYDQSSMISMQSLTTIIGDR